MTPDSISDLVLFLVCAAIVHRCWLRNEGEAALGLAGMLIGTASMLGVMRFSSWAALVDVVKGAHQFASIFAAVGGFPLLAIGILRPESSIARYRAGAWWCAFVIGGIGMAIWLLGFKPWAQTVPALCGIWMLAAIRHKPAGRDRNVLMIGLALLFMSFAAVLSFPAASRVQPVHYSLAMALSLLVLVRSHLAPARTTH